jgi:hypothetical protein
MVARGSVWYKSGDSALITVRGISTLLKVPYTVALRLSKTGQIPGKVELSAAHAVSTQCRGGLAAGRRSVNSRSPLPLS